MTTLMEFARNLVRNSYPDASDVAVEEVAQLWAASIDRAAKSGKPNHTDAAETALASREIIARDRLEYLRTQLRNECIAWGELAELQSLADYIAPDDVELLEAAGVPEQAQHNKET